ncbi:MAG: dual specificity protein phosphatase family protein [Candidatus Delongbacteria bacterium]|nr:dual specificity protein phosphatase family protein [Candidatus Delongbacteria bacterium]MCG2761451.1 dual specificity protein phosphatase family protein [Candidatus Delongbacteria bacterium]
MDYVINWIDSTYINVKGKIGIGRAPGYGSNRFDDFRYIKDQNISKIYCLQEEDELAYLGNGETVKDREASLNELGIELVHSPIGDFRIPTVEQAKELSEMIFNDVMSGRNILIHCMGGLGRSGTIAACALVRYGMKADEAITIVRTVRPGTIEINQQVEFVRGFGDE